MLEEHEWKLISPLLTNQIENIKKYRAKHGVGLKEAEEGALKLATDKYYELTGFEETNYLAIWNRRLKNYGPECTRCGHLFRTPQATFCANCGLKADENI